MPEKTNPVGRPVGWRSPSRKPIHVSISLSEKVGGKLERAAKRNGVTRAAFAASILDTALANIK